MLLAHAPAAEIEAKILEAPTEAIPDRPTEMGRLKGELAEIRRTGLAAEGRESGRDIAGVASRMIFPSRGAIAAIGLRGPAGRLDPVRESSAVLEAARAVECRLRANRAR